MSQPRLGGQRCLSLNELTEAHQSCHDPHGRVNWDALYATLDEEESALLEIRLDGVSRVNAGSHLGWDSARVERVWRRLNRRLLAFGSRGGFSGGDSLHTVYRERLDWQFSRVVLDQTFAEVMAQERLKINFRNFESKRPRMPNLGPIDRSTKMERTDTDYGALVSGIVAGCPSYSAWAEAKEISGQLCRDLNHTRDELAKMRAEAYRIANEQAARQGPVLVKSAAEAEELVRKGLDLHSRIEYTEAALRILEESWSAQQHEVEQARIRLEIEADARLRPIHAQLVAKMAPALRALSEAFTEELDLLAAMSEAGIRTSSIAAMKLPGIWSVREPECRLRTWLANAEKNGYMLDKPAAVSKKSAA